VVIATRSAAVAPPFAGFHRSRPIAGESLLAAPARWLSARPVLRKRGAVDHQMRSPAKSVGTPSTTGIAVLIPTPPLTMAHGHAANSAHTAVRPPVVLRIATGRQAPTPVF
jgi:hypothetical protein